MSEPNLTGAQMIATILQQIADHSETYDKGWSSSEKDAWDRERLRLNGVMRRLQQDAKASKMW